MAKSRPLRRKKKHQTPSYGKIKNPVKPKWMQITKIIAIILLSLLLVLAMVSMAIKHYRHISKH